MIEERQIPLPVVKRLTKYLFQVQRWLLENRAICSSNDLAQAFDLTASTVRQDLQYIDFSGKAKQGYELAGLEEGLRKILGLKSPKNAIIVGIGNLGRALARHGNFMQEGFNVCAIFDNDTSIVGTQVGSLRVRDAADMQNFLDEHDVTIGIIAVPSTAAQEVADQLVKSHIKGILNLSSAHLRLPPGVRHVNARLVESLQELSCLIEHRE